MKLIYWITVLGAIDTMTFIFSAIGTIAAIAFSIIRFCAKCDSDFRSDDTGAKSTRKIAIVLWIIAAINIVATVFIPDKTELYAIYGIGDTIDYLNENPEAKALPDKTIKMLNLMADEFIDKHEKSSDDDNQNSKTSDGKESTEK